MGFLSAAIGAIAGGLGQASANRETKKSTQKQMDFQERMSNTAHVRQMADLKKAGLNPILAAKYGGSSSPSGGSYTAGNTGAAAVTGAQAGQATSASKQTQSIEKTMAQQTLSNAKSTGELIQAQTGKALAETEGVERDNSIKKPFDDASQLWGSAKAAFTDWKKRAQQSSIFKNDKAESNQYMKIYNKLIHSGMKPKQAMSEAYKTMAKMHGSTNNKNELKIHVRRGQ